MFPPIIIKPYLTDLLAGRVFMHKIWLGRRAHWLIYEYINNSDLDGISLASFCQSRAALFLFIFWVTYLAGTSS